MKQNDRAEQLLLAHMQRSYTAVRTLTGGEPPVHAPDDRVAKFTLNYLDAFGYLTNELEQWKDIKVGDIIDAVKAFQDFFGLAKTGELTSQTVRAMEQPRCGCPDIIRARHTEAAGLRDFVNASLPRWKKTGIAYTIQDYLPGLSKTDFEQTVYTAFQNWCQLGQVDVRPASPGQSADIVISNGQGPQSNFDGPGGTLAWAYLPDGSDQQLLMRFDLGETWTLQPTSRGILVANVACHEFGHLLGLSHSKVQSALMAPYYNATTSTPQEQDDIPRFQARYGARTDGGTNPPPPPPPPPPAGGGRTVVVTGAATVTVDGRQVA